MKSDPEIVQLNYCTTNGLTWPKNIEGLSFEDFPAFESRFAVKLEAYNLTEDEFAQSVYKS